MSLIKCPRCELNYMLDTDKMCSVCKREVRGESEQFDLVETCSECGENPVVPGQELCAYCLKELAKRASEMQDEESVVNSATDIGIDSVSTMDEIELDIGEGLDEDMSGEVFDDEDDDFFDDEDDNLKQDGEQ